MDRMWHCNRLFLSTSFLPFQYYFANAPYSTLSNVARNRKTNDEGLETYKKNSFENRETMNTKLLSFSCNELNILLLGY